MVMRVGFMMDEGAFDDGKTGPVKIGWCTGGDEPAVLFDPPERVRSVGVERTHAKSASRCPAVINMESRYFCVKCPYDIHISLVRDEEGKIQVVNRAGKMSSIRRNKLAKVVHLTNETEWRYPDRPTLQLTIPYIFTADEPVWVTQTDAFAHYRKTPLPGTIFGGRFPVHVWPRPLVWAFEWHDLSKELVLKRGDPLYYVMFESNGPERPVQMIEIEKTPEFEEYQKSISGAVNYVDKTFSLFEAAERMRPTTLVTPKK